MGRWVKPLEDIWLRLGVEKPSLQGFSEAPDLDSLRRLLCCCLWLVGRKGVGWVEETAPPAWRIWSCSRPLCPVVGLQCGKGRPQAPLPQPSHLVGWPHHSWGGAAVVCAEAEPLPLPRDWPLGVGRPLPKAVENAVQ